VHARSGIAFLDDSRFGHSKLLEAIVHFVFAAEEPREPHVRGMVPRLGLEQAAVKGGKLLIPHVPAQQVEPLARTGLDEPRHEQPVDGPERLLLANQLVQPAAVAARRQAAKADAPPGQEVEHLVKVRKLFLHDLGHGAAQLFLLDVREQEVHGRAGRLLFAMGVVDEDFIQIPLDLAKPAVRRCRLKAEHDGQNEKG
jgi:hypothetical protein